jgi:hypothetical protein
MKSFYIIVFLLIHVAICTAQERFNKVIFDSDGQVSVSMNVYIDTIFTLSVNGTDYPNQFLNFKKISPEGIEMLTKRYSIENHKIYGGVNNLHKSSYSDEFYACGSIYDMINDENRIYIINIDLDLDTTFFKALNIDTVYSSYDIIELNDSIYGLSCQNLSPEDFASILIYDRKNDSILNNRVYDCGGAELSGVGSSISKTFDSGFIIGGLTSAYSSGTYKQDWLIIKTDEIGVPVWERYFGNSTINDTWVFEIAETNDTNYIAVGGHGITNWSGDPILEGCLRKIDTSGNLIWEKFYRRYDFDNDASLMRYSNMYISDIIEFDNGSFAATLNYKRAEGDGGAYRFRLFKFNSKGEIIFSRTMQNTNIVYTQSLFPSSLMQTSDNGFVINGYGEYTWDYNPEQQLWLIKTDSLGCEGELYPEPPTENVECPDFPDTMYCDGTYNSRLRVQGKSAPYTLEFSTGELIENLYYPPVFIPKSQGTGSFTVHVGVDTYNHSYDTATLFNPIPAEDMEPDIIELPFSLTIPENYFGPDLTVTITNSFGESYEITLPVYVDCNVSAEQITEKSNISIYPNPASDFLQISLPQFEENSFVKIVNAQGQTVLVEQLFNAETELNISELVAGSYVVRVYCGKRISNIQFTKM